MSQNNFTFQSVFFNTIFLFLVAFFSFAKPCQAFDSPSPVEKNASLTAEERYWVAEHGPIKVGGGPDWAPFDFADASGRYQGLAWDYLKLISQKTGLQFQVEVNTWNQNLALFKANKIDLLPAVYETAERKSFMHFSSPYYSMLDYFFIREDVEAKQLDDLDGLRVAIPKGYAHIQFIKTHFPSIKIIEVDTLGDAIDSVVEGKAELLYDTYAVLNYLLEKDGIRTIKPFESSRKVSGKKLIRFATHPSDSMLAAIFQKGLNAISVAEERTISNRWLIQADIEQTVKKIALTDEEKNWLESHPHIRFAGDPNWLPYEAYDEKGDYIGIVAEYLKLIEKKLNIKLEKIQTKDWQESIDKVNKGQIDVLSETSDSTLRKSLEFTESYLSSPIVIVMSDAQSYVENLQQIKDKKIAMIREYGYVDTISKANPDITFLEVPSIQAGLTAVSTGKVDALLATLAQASYHMSELGINNIRIVGETGYRTQLAFGIRKDYAPLVSMFNRALKDISLKDKQQILDDWGRYKFATKVDYSLIIKLVLGFLFFVLMILLWNRKLAREVSLRKEAQAQTKVLIDHLPLQIAVTSHSGEILTANPKALADYKLTLKQAQTYNILDFYADESARKDVLEDLKTKGLVKERIINFRDWEGDEHAMMVSIMPIFYDKRPALLSIAVDMTERLEMEAALKLAKERAEIANKSKSDFLANMSHEIRTPMNAILGFTELLEDKVKDSKLKSYVKTIRSAGNDLLLLINDILDLSKIEAGKMEISKTAANPHSLFDELHQIFKVSMDSKGLELVVDVESQIPESLILDLTRLRQVLLNLLGNAVKFTEQGYVKLAARIDGEKADGSQIDLRIDVEDSGIGISEEHLATIFEEFQQTQGQDHSKYGGTGLGLSISQRLVHLMGGTLSVESQLGKGATFTVHLKDVDVASISVIEEAASTFTAASYEFEPATILVVDDVANNRHLVMENFENTAIKILQAENGEQAISVYENHQVDLILMDLRMPVMNGYDAAKYLKQHHQVPIIALTASVMLDDFEHLKTENFDSYLRKPVNRHELFDRLAEFLPYQEVVREEQNEGLELTDAEYKALPQVVDKLRLQLQVWETIKDNNNLSATKVFVQQLALIADDQQFGPLKTYADTLLEKIDVFDIQGINQGVNAYADFFYQLEQYLDR